MYEMESTLLSTYSLRDSNPGRPQSFHFSRKRPYRFWDPINLLYNMCQEFQFAWVKQSEREANFLLAPSIEAENVWSYTSE
jgi:hypothetical protein